MINKEWELKHGTKIKVRITQRAESILKHDLSVYYPESIENTPSLAGICNEIFLKFYKLSNSAIEYQFEMYKEELQKILNDSYDDDESQDIIETICAAKRIEIKNEVSNSNYEIDGSIVKLGKLNGFSVRNEVLTAINDSCEYLHYKTPHEFFSSVIEEYTRLNIFEREKIFYNEFVTTIKEAISENKRVKVTLKPILNVNKNTETKKTFNFSPLGFSRDITKPYLYFVGLAQNVNSDECSIASIRATKIESLHITKSKSDIKKNDTTIADKLHENSVTFLVGQPMEATIKLTDKGIEQYKQQLSMRPAIKTTDDPNIFKVNCPELQILHYFVKMGRDVEILEPEKLRKAFYNRHKTALDNYIDENGIYKKSQN